MKYLSIKSMAGIVAMVSTSLSAQTTVPDKLVDVPNQIEITKVKYDDMNNSSEKSFTGDYTLSIAAAGSTPTNSTYDYSYSSVGCVYFNNNSGYMETNLHLPDGHAIKGVAYKFKDGDNNNSSMRLLRYSDGSSFENMVSIDSYGNSGDYYGAYIGLPTFHIVNNAKYTYVVQFYSDTPGSSQQMCGAQIYMTATP